MIASGNAGAADGQIAYSPITERPRIVWPGGARLAVWLALNIEHYQYLPPANAFINPWPRVQQPPDTMMYGYYDFANRVGLWRMLEVIDAHRVPMTASVNVAVLDHFPEIANAIAERQWGVMCHGIYNTEYLFGMDEGRERAFFADITESVRRRLGRELRGLLGPAGSVTENTMRLAAEAGLNYCADWAIDDQPFPVLVPTGRLVGVPYGFDVNDDSMMALGYGAAGYEADEFLRVAKDQFETLYAEGAQSGRVMCVGLHGHVFGQPHRIAYLDKLFEFLCSHDGVWMTTADDIAAYYIDHYLDEQLTLLGVNNDRHG
jgi:allantoinase